MKLGIKSMNVYVPARDLDESKQFYIDLGFNLTEAWGGNFDCRLGNAVFRLQNYYVKDWAENFMLQFWVEDAHEWYDFVKPIIENGRYKHARISKPETIGDKVITHVVDPSGVLLIFIQ